MGNNRGDDSPGVIAGCKPMAMGRFIWMDSSSPEWAQQALVVESGAVTVVSHAPRSPSLM